MPPQSSEVDSLQTVKTEEKNEKPEEREENATLELGSSRNVKFSTDVTIYPILHRRDMSSCEIENAWSNRHDLKESRQLLNNTVFLMKTGAGALLTEDDYFCSRGLEHLIDGSRSEQIKKSHHIALAMQRMLRRSGSRSPEMIAKAYKVHTLRSQRAAYKRALKDRDDAGR